MKVNTIIASIAGTTAFTLVSYAASGLMHEDFKQPKLLGQIVDRSSNLNKKQSAFTGWLMHYLIGFGFTAAYQQIVERTNIKPNLKNGAMIGALSSIPAALSWYTTLDLHPRPPRNKNLSYFTELLLGHIIFGAVCLAVMSTKKHNNNKQTIHGKSNTAEDQSGECLPGVAQ